MQKFQARLTYANLVATLALFVALGGASAFAAGRLAKGSVGSRQLKAGAVSTAKIKDGAVTGAKVDVASLPRVPSAASATSAADATTLGGDPAAAFARGDARILSARVDLRLAESRPLITIPGVGSLSAYCKAGVANPVIGAVLTNETGAALDETLEYNSAVDGTVLLPGKPYDFNEEGLLVDRIKVASRGAPPTLATVDLSGLLGATPDTCVVFTQVIVSG